MSLHAYKVSRELLMADPPFAALIMAAYRKADTRNTNALRAAFPDICAEMDHRYWSAGALLPGESGYDPERDDYEAQRP